MKAQRLWKCRSVGNAENQSQVSPVAHRPWKSLRDSHIPTASVTNADGKVEIQNQDSHFPTARFLSYKTQSERSPGADRSAPAFRLRDRSRRRRGSGWKCSTGH